MRYAARVDANQAEIVDALRKAGAYVWIIGLPTDLLVGYKQHTLVVEVKTNSKKKMTELQKDFFKEWTGGPLCRVNDVESALRMLRMIDENVSRETDISHPNS